MHKSLLSASLQIISYPITHNCIWIGKMLIAYIPFCQVGQTIIFVLPTCSNNLIYYVHYTHDSHRSR